MFISTSELKQEFQTKRIGTLKELLSLNKIPFFTDRFGNPFTTQEALSQALGIKQTQIIEDGFNIDHLTK